MPLLVKKKLNLNTLKKLFWRSQSRNVFPICVSSARIVLFFKINSEKASWWVVRRPHAEKQRIYCYTCKSYLPPPSIWAMFLMEELAFITPGAKKKKSVGELALATTSLRITKCVCFKEAVLGRHLSLQDFLFWNLKWLVAKKNLGWSTNRSNDRWRRRLIFVTHSRGQQVAP